MRARVVPLLVVPLLALLSASAAHAIATCHGLPATIESGATTVLGTSGDDVIVATADDATVSALAGNDTICMSGGKLDPGPGDDDVLVAPPPAVLASIQADLGDGQDHYTSSGNVLDSVTSGVPGVANHDVIDLGDGDDQLELTLPVGSNVQAKGGSSDAREDSLRLLADPGDTGSWDVQLPGTVTRNGVSMGSFTNYVSVSAGTVDVDLGMGDDVLELGGRSGPLPTSGRLAMGGGTVDQLYASSEDRLSVDLGHKLLGGVTVTGVERTQLLAPTVRYVGTRRADDVTAYGCQVTMYGGAGNDRLGPVNRDERPDLDCTPKLAVFGQGGNDKLYGGPGSDVLVGGPGFDTGNGGQGAQDRCSAEKEYQCER